MGPQSEGRPSMDGRNYGSQHPDDGRRYQSERDVGTQDYTGLSHTERYQSDRDIHMQDAPLPRPNGAFGMENRMTTSPSGSASGRDRDGEPSKTSGERPRSRSRNGRTASGQLRMCKKCGEPLTGQFVRALGGTFHLECFRCRVSLSCCVSSLHALMPLFCRTVGKL